MDKPSYRKFQSMLDEGFSRLKKRDFVKAVAVYNRLDDAYELLSDIDREKIKTKFERFFRELELYMRVNEAFKASREGDLSKLKDELEIIHDLSFELEDIVEIDRPVFDYVKEKYKYLLDLYNFKASIKMFNGYIASARTKLDNNNIDDAKKMYSRAVIVYHKIVDKLSYEKRLECYNTMKKLFVDISAKGLFVKENINVKRIPEIKKLKKKNNAKIKVKSLKISAMNADKKKSKTRKAKEIEIRKPKRKMDSIRALIKKGNIEDAERLL